MTLPEIAVAAGFVLLLLWAWLASRPICVREKVRKHYSGWRLIYSDARGRTPKGVERSKLLRAVKKGLTGKPDMIYRRVFGRGLMPVELKSGSIKDANAPHDGDLLQLAAYFVLIEENFGVRPRYGRIIYADAAFRVRNTRALRTRLADTLTRMRRMLEQGADNETPNASYASCRYCMCKQTVCEVSYFQKEEG